MEKGGYYGARTSAEPRERRYEFASVLQDASTGTTRVYLATAMRVAAELVIIDQYHK